MAKGENKKMTQELTVVSKQEMIVPTKEDYQEMGVGEPKNMLEVRALASFLARSKFIPQSFRGDLNTAVMLIVTCKQYGLPITALNETMEVNGKVGFWGRTLLGIVLRSPICEYIMPVEVTDKKAVVVAKRKGWPKEVTIEYTIDMAEKAGLLNKDNWKKHPADMLLHKANSRAISRVFPDVCQGMEAVEDLEENRVQEVQAVAMPEEVEMPKPKKARKVKAVVASEPEVVEEKSESQIIPTAKEMESYDIKGEEATVEAATEEALFEVPEEPAKEKKTLAPEPKRIVRFVKQVLLESGERYIVGQNPLSSAIPADKFRIPTAGMAGELKKLTGMKVYLFVAENTVYGYEEYQEQN
jgi:hypothetical protein